MVTSEMMRVAKIKSMRKDQEMLSNQPVDPLAPPVPENVAPQSGPGPKTAPDEGILSAVGAAPAVDPMAAMIPQG
jgi:hypothetical protein